MDSKFCFGGVTATCSMPIQQERDSIFSICMYVLSNCISLVCLEDSCLQTGRAGRSVWCNAAVSGYTVTWPAITCNV